MSPKVFGALLDMIVFGPSQGVTQLTFHSVLHLDQDIKSLNPGETHLTLVYMQ